jgi:hypothetical protein
MITLPMRTGITTQFARQPTVENVVSNQPPSTIFPSNLALEPFLKKGPRSFEPASLGAASPAVKCVASWAKSLKGGIRVPQSVRAAGEEADVRLPAGTPGQLRAGLSRSARFAG